MLVQMEMLQHGGGLGMFEEQGWKKRGTNAQKVIFHPLWNGKGQLDGTVSHFIEGT